MTAPAATLLEATPTRGVVAPRMRRMPSVERHGPPSEVGRIAALEREVAGLRALIAQRQAERDAALSMLKAAMALLNEGATEREPSHAALEAALAQSRAEAEQARTELAKALDYLRAHLLSRLPARSSHFVSGATVAEMEESYFQARALVERVRQGVHASLTDDVASGRKRSDPRLKLNQVQDETRMG